MVVTILFGGCGGIVFLVVRLRVRVWWKRNDCASVCMCVLVVVVVPVISSCDCRHSYCYYCCRCWFIDGGCGVGVGLVIQVSIRSVILYNYNLRNFLMCRW